MKTIDLLEDNTFYTLYKQATGLIAQVTQANTRRMFANDLDEIVGINMHGEEYNDYVALSQSEANLVDLIRDIERYLAKSGISEAADSEPSLKKALTYLASKPYLYTTSREAMNMLIGWLRHSDPESAALLEKIFDNTKEADMRPGPRL